MTEDKYSDILSRSWDDIPEPKNLPVGTWLLKGGNASYIPKKDGSEQDARVLFFYEAKEPMDDVDQTDLAALGPDYDFAENDIVKQFYVRRNKDWDAVRKHLELHGITVTGGVSIQDALKSFKGSEVLSYLNVKTYTKNDGTVVTSNDPTTFAAV